MNKILQSFLYTVAVLTCALGQGPLDLNPQLTPEDGDVYVPNSSYGTVLTAPNGDCFRIRVMNNGTLMTEAISCPSSNPGAVHPPLNFSFEGYGGITNTQHSSVYAVTNLNDSGAGSLRAAPAGSYIVFPNLSGTINTATPIVANKNNQWVMGQTSPAGIQVRGSINQDHDGIITITGNDQVWQHLRVRPDQAPPPPATNCCHSALGLIRSTRTVIDHMSLYWGDDESMTVYQSDDFSVLNSIIAEGVVGNSRSTGLIVIQSDRGTVAKNLFAFSKNRGPLVKDGVFLDVINNVAYGHIRDFEFATEGELTTINFKKNIEIQGAASSTLFWQDVVVKETAGVDLQLFEEGNVKLTSFNAACATAEPLIFINGCCGGSSPLPAQTSAFVNTPHASPGINEVDICQLREYIANDVGAFNSRNAAGEPVRDALDTRIINDMKNSRLQNLDLNTYGPWPTMTGGNTKNPWDLSKPDKLSDQAKIACGIDPSIQNTTLTFTNGGSSNDFLYIINSLYGL